MDKKSSHRKERKKRTNIPIKKTILRTGTMYQTYFAIYFWVLEIKGKEAVIKWDDGIIETMRVRDIEYKLRKKEYWKA